MAHSTEVINTFTEAFRKAVRDPRFVSESSGALTIRRHPDQSVYLSAEAAQLLLAVMDGNGRFIVMRRAVNMEDEGRETVVHVWNTRPEAEAWIAQQKGQYFSPSDYYIATP